VELEYIEPRFSGVAQEFYQGGNNEIAEKEISYTSLFGCGAFNPDILHF
jgi:hypothetical protein